MCKVAILCNYLLLPDRIGGMDHFFKRLDDNLKDDNISCQWYFPGDQKHSLYNNFNLKLSGSQSVESLFLKDFSEYDIVMTHFTELCSSFYKQIKIRYPKTRVIAVDHNPRPLGGFDIRTRVKRRLKGLLYGRFIDQFIAVSSYSEKHLIKDFGKQIKNKITVVHNGLDKSKFQLKNTYSDSNRFIVASHLREQKGIQYLIEAIAKSKSSLNENFVCDIYGEGPYENHLKGMVKSYDLDSLVVFKGSVDNLYTIYHQYDYLIHPSLGETYCYSVVESLLVGLPVITTKDSGNVLGLVQEGGNGFLYNETDKTKLSKIITKINQGTIRIGKQDLESVVIPDLSLNSMVDNYLNLLSCT